MKTFNEQTMIPSWKMRRNLKTWFDGNGIKHRYWMRDTSGGSAQGYSYDLVEQKYIQRDYYDENGLYICTDWFWEDVRKIGELYT